MFCSTLKHLSTLVTYQTNAVMSCNSYLFSQHLIALQYTSACNFCLAIQFFWSSFRLGQNVQRKVLVSRNCWRRFQLSAQSFHHTCSVMLKVCQVYLPHWGSFISFPRSCSRLGRGIPRLIAHPTRRLRRLVHDFCPDPNIDNRLTPLDLIPNTGDKKI